MSTPRRWFDRKFELGLASDLAPELLERLRNTPQRLADLVRDLPPALLTRKPEGKWSIQENAGHLLDLESLWDQRLDDYDAGTKELHPADLETKDPCCRAQRSANLRDPGGVWFCPRPNRRAACADEPGGTRPHRVASAPATTDVRGRSLLLRRRARRSSSQDDWRTEGAGLRSEVGGRKSDL